MGSIMSIAKLSLTALLNSEDNYHQNLKNTTKAIYKLIVLQCSTKLLFVHFISMLTFLIRQT